MAIMRAPDKAVLLITHYQRLLDVVKPDKVSILSQGRIVQRAARRKKATTRLAACAPMESNEGVRDGGSPD